MKATNYGLAKAAQGLFNKGFFTINIANIVEEFNLKHGEQEDYRDYTPKVKAVRRILRYYFNIPVFLVGRTYFWLSMDQRPDLNTHLNGFKPTRGNPSFGLFLPSIPDAAMSIETTVWETRNFITRRYHTMNLVQKMKEDGLLTENVYNQLLSAMG